MSRIGLESLSVRSLGDGGYQVVNIDEAVAIRAKETLAVVGEDPRRLGLTEADVLIALGKNRDLLSPFGNFCTIYGNLFKYLGASTGAMIGLVAFLYTAYGVAELGVSLVGVIRRFVKKLVPSSSAKDADWGSFDEEDNSFDVLTVITAFLPAPITAVINYVIKELKGQPTGGSGTSSSKQALGEQLISGLNSIAYQDGAQEMDRDEVVSYQG